MEAILVRSTSCTSSGKKQGSDRKDKPNDKAHSQFHRHSGSVSRQLWTSYWTPNVSWWAPWMAASTITAWIERVCSFATSVYSKAETFYIHVWCLEVPNPKCMYIKLILQLVPMNWLCSGCPLLLMNKLSDCTKVYIVLNVIPADGFFTCTTVKTLFTAVSVGPRCRNICLPVQLLIVCQVWAVEAIQLFCSHGGDKPLKPSRHGGMPTGYHRDCNQVSLYTPPPASTRPLTHTHTHTHTSS